MTSVVGRALPFHCTAAPDTKFDPFTVRVNAGPPRVAALGDRAVIVGVGLGTTPELLLPLPPPHAVDTDQGRRQNFEAGSMLCSSNPNNPFTKTQYLRDHDDRVFREH